MFPRVSSVTPTGDFRVLLRFTDGTSAEADLREWIVGRGGVFKPLEEPAFFRQVRVNPEFGTIEWPNQVDFDPDVLYSRATGKELSALK
jgi:hypothetical protein